jgi:hypothetical protein
MAIADLILSRISGAGFAVEVRTGADFASESWTVKAADPATGRFWMASGPTLADAAATLAMLLHVDLPENPEEIDYASIPTPTATSHSVHPMDVFAWSIPLALTLTAIVFVLDLFTQGVSLGIFYLVPLCLAFQTRVRDRYLLWLTVVMILLMFVDGFVAELHPPALFHAEPSGIFNRGLAIVAILASFFVMIAVRHTRRPRWHRESPWKKVAIHCANDALDQKFGLCASVIIVATFAADLVTNVCENMAILYLIPLSIIAMACRRIPLWPVAAMVLALLVLGYLVSPRGNVNADDVQLVLVNRMVTASCMVATTALFRLSAKFIGTSAAIQA